MAFSPLPEHPADVHNSLIEAVHSAIRAHPNALRKASYGKMLAGLLADQAKEHQANLQGGGRASTPFTASTESMGPLQRSSVEAPVTGLGAAAAALGHGAVDAGDNPGLIPGQIVNPLPFVIRELLAGLANPPLGRGEVAY